MDFFSRGEVAEITGLEKAVIKNWTMGRPLKITPSVKQARGVGTRNYYSKEDIYLIYLARGLNEKGLAMSRIQHVVDQVKGIWVGSADRENSWLLIEDYGPESTIEFLSEAEARIKFFMDYSSKHSEGEEIFFARYAVNLKALKLLIAERAKRLTFLQADINQNHEPSS